MTSTSQCVTQDYCCVHISLKPSWGSEEGPIAMGKKIAPHPRKRIKQIKATLFQAQQVPGAQPCALGLIWRVRSFQKWNQRGACSGERTLPPGQVYPVEKQNTALWLGCCYAGVQYIHKSARSGWGAPAHPMWGPHRNLPASWRSEDSTDLELGQCPRPRTCPPLPPPPPNAQPPLP